MTNAEYKQTKRADVRFIEPIKDLLPWRDYKKMPYGKELIVVIHTDGTMACNYAINVGLYWSSKYIDKWCYYNDVITKRYISNDKRRIHTHH